MFEFKHVNIVQQELSPLIVFFYHKYIKNGGMQLQFVEKRDEILVFAILQKNLKSTIDIHLFYRWMGISSDWASEGDFLRAGTMSVFWEEYRIQRKSRDIIEKLILDIRSLNKIQ